MLNKNKFIGIIIGLLFVVGVFTLAPSLKPVDPGPKTFEEIHQEVKDFYKKEVGFDVRTPVRETYDWNFNQQLSGVLAYCWLAPDNKFITFNHELIQQTAKGNMDFVFQVILHEYTHCEGNVGHIQMPGHFQNDGGNPELTKAQVKEQFKDFLTYYRKFYRKLQDFDFREEDDLNAIYALTIETDANGKIKLKCPCSTCSGININ